MVSSKMKERMGRAESWICPDCESRLEKIPAKKMHPAHSGGALARGCTNPKCDYMCYMGGG